MNALETTCWTLINQAATGDARQRQEFATRYYPVVDAYMAARWRDSRLRSEIADACQEVFAECFRESGPLAKADRKRPGGFRAFLYGIVRNVALRIEKRKRRDFVSIAGFDLEQDETSLSQAFDRAWAVTVIKDAGLRQAELAEQDGPAAFRRVELLKLRFRDALPIREIASQWQVDAAVLHREYSKARSEFMSALTEVLNEENPGSSQRELKEQCRELLSLLN